MPYFVVAQDGNRYGPADIGTLNQWAQQGRVLPHQTVEDASTGMRMMASQVPGLHFGVQAPPMHGDRYQTPVAPMATAFNFVPADDGSRDIRTAWIYAVVGMLCFPPAAIGGIIFANRARRKGHPGAISPLMSSWGALIVGMILFFASLAVLSRFKDAGSIDPSDYGVKLDGAG